MPPQGYPGYPSAGPNGFGPQGSYAAGLTRPGGSQPKGSDTKIIGVVVAVVAVFALVGGVIMSISGRSTTVPDQPTISQPADPSTDPAAPSSNPQSVTTVPLAAGVTAKLPNANWKVEDQVTGGVVIVNASAKVYMQMQVQAGQKTDSITFCGVIQDGAAKDLANVKKTACHAGNSFGRVKTASGSLSGVFASKNGSYELGTVVLVGFRDDGLVSGTQLFFPVKSPPAAAITSEVSTIWASILASQSAA